MRGLSVLTLVKNREAHLLQLIAGLRRGSVVPHELVIVNMGNDVLNLPATDFPVHVIEFPSDHLPLAQARNLAASQARFTTMLFLDVDCIPMRGLLAAMGRAMDCFDGLLCAEIRYLAAQDLSGKWDEQALLRNAAKHPVRSFPEQGLRVEANYGLFWSLAFAVRRDRFHALGGFDERFTGYGAEDTDFAFRARDADVALAFLGGAGAFHQHHAVYDPPLQHFEDIVINAQLFHDIRNEWPMAGWLQAFETMGLIAIKDDRLRILRQPGQSELAGARKNDSAAF